MAAIAMKPRVKGAGMPMPAPNPMDEDYSEDMAEGGVEDDPDADEEDSAKLDDTEILSILDAEKQQSIGFENGVELERKRRTSLEYSKAPNVPDAPIIFAVQMVCAVPRSTTQRTANVLTPEKMPGLVPNRAATLNVP